MCNQSSTQVVLLISILYKQQKGTKREKFPNFHKQNNALTGPKTPFQLRTKRKGYDLQRKEGNGSSSLQLYTNFYVLIRVRVRKVPGRAGRKLTRAYDRLVL